MQGLTAQNLARYALPGRIRAGGIERDVSFERLAADSPVQHDTDASYHAKYDRYGPQMVGAVVGPAAGTTAASVL